MVPFNAIPAVDRRWSVVTVGFGSAVAMWGAGYLSRLPAVMLPSPLLLTLVLFCVCCGGWVLGRYGGLGWRHGALAGIVTGTINLLVLGSFLTAAEGPRAPSALAWLPGSILLSALLSGLGAQVGLRWFRRDSPYGEWAAAFVRVAIGAVLLLLVVGGLVTSTGTGLAVVDWPNSFGYNMFLYPFSRMTGGIYYEHAHRLFGALVGLTTMVLAIHLQLREPRRWVRRLSWAIFCMVVVQGVMGGMRVTGGFTLSSSPEQMRPSLLLAMVHGIFGQLVFAALVALGAFTARSWRRGPVAGGKPTARLDRGLAVGLVLLVLAQLVLGAAQRHFGSLLIVHIVFGVAIVAPAAFHVGFRTWGIHDDQRPLKWAGLAVAGAVALQIVLGLGAFIGTRAAAAGELAPGVEVLLTTLHQGFGAVLLGLAVTLACWSFRLLIPQGRSLPLLGEQ